MTRWMAKVLQMTAGLFVVTAFASAAAAQGFPTKPIRIIVPYPPGGPLDVIARGLAQSMQESWKQPAFVENKPGANEIIAADNLAKAAPDGHTMMLASEAATVINPLLYKRLPYNAAADLKPIVRVATAPLVLVTRTGLPTRDLSGFIAFAKQSPGKVNFGSGGLGNPTHLALALLEKQQGIQVTHIPYKGAAPLMQDILAGVMDASFFPVSIVAPFVQAGTLRGLAISGPSRVSSLPGVPTFTQAGVTDVDASFYLQIVMPSKVPDAIAAHVAAHVRKISNDPSFGAKYLDAFGFSPVQETIEEFAAFRVKDLQVQTEKVKASGVKLEF